MFLFLGIPLSWSTPNDTTQQDEIWRTEIGRSMLQKVLHHHNSDISINGDDIRVLYIMIWSEDFQPSQLKQSERSVWLLTVTVCPPHHLCTSPFYTFTVAMGTKSQNHENIINRLMNKIRQLKDITE
jgi:hypothetical protein